MNNWSLSLEPAVDVDVDVDVDGLYLSDPRNRTQAKIVQSTKFGVLNKIIVRSTPVLLKIGNPENRMEPLPPERGALHLSKCSCDVQSPEMRPSPWNP